MFKLNFNNFRNIVTLIGLIIGLTLIVIYDPDQREAIEIDLKKNVFGKKYDNGFEELQNRYWSKYYKPNVYKDEFNRFKCKLDLYEEISSSVSSNCNDKNLSPKCSSENKTQICYGKKDYTDGTYYIGELENNEPNGIGAYTFLHKIKLYVYSVDGVTKGKGYKVDEKGRVASIGYFKDGVEEGETIIIGYNPKRIYIGTLVDTLKHGKGISVDEHSVYVGEYNKGQQDGYGEFTDTRRSYKGFFKYGKFHGPEGTWKHVDGDVYSGEWEFNQAHGAGKYTYSSGDVYIGNFFRDMRHGHGEYRYIKDGTYIGNYEYGFLNDPKAIFKNKIMVCVGGFSNDRAHGVQECNLNDGGYSKTHWKHGIEHGAHYIFRSNKVKTYSTYADGVENGEIKKVYPDGKVIKWIVTDGIPSGQITEEKSGVYKMICDYDYGIKENCITQQY